MKCPHCKKELELKPYVEYNVDAYGKTVIATTLCCGKGVKVHAVRSIAVDVYNGFQTEDDWGHPIKK